jgi:hypothetical protein
MEFPVIATTKVFGNKAQLLALTESIVQAECDNNSKVVASPLPMPTKP